MKTVPLKEATQEQMLRYATVHLGLSGIQPNTGEEKLRAKIKAATNEDVIYIQESAEHDVKAEAKVKVEKQRSTPRGRQAPVINALNFAVRDPRYLITIAADKTKDGKRPIFVAVNGMGMLIPRQQKVEVPARYFFALENAIADVVEDGELIPGSEGETRTITQTPAYNYTVHREPTQQELDEWHALMEELGAKAENSRAA